MSKRSRLPDMLFLITLAALGLWLFRPPPPPSPESRLIGTWEASNPGGTDRVQVTFRPDKTLELRELEGRREVKTATYRADFSIVPAQLDIQFEGKTLQTIMELTSDGGLKISDGNPGQPRPRDFSRKILFFKRAGG